MRTSSPTTAPRSSSVTVVSAVSPDASLTIVKWRSASEAICGRWVMQTTWRPAESAAQLLADGARGLPADAGVDLVEDERRAAALPRAGDAHQREHHARELAARGRLAQRAGRHAGVGRDQELDLVGAGRAGRLARRQADGEAGALHGELGEALAHGVREPRARGRARVVQRRRVLGEHAARRLQAPRALLERLLGALELGAPLRALARVLEHRGDRAAVLALEAVELGQALLDLVEAARAPPRSPRRSRAAPRSGRRPRARAPARGR